MNLDLPYKCKFCGRDGVAHYDSACPTLDLDIWKQMLACNRCADFHARHRALSDSIWKDCHTLSVLLANKDQSVRSEALRCAREALANKTKKFAGLICTFYHKATIWEPDFIQMLIDKPDQCHKILSLYERGVRPA